MTVRLPANFDILLGVAKPKRSKYGNKRVQHDGIWFHSIKERDRYVELKLMEKAGLISHLELQPKFKLYGKSGPVLIKSKGYPNGRHMTWIGDFAYFCSERDRRVCEDVKGFRTREYIIKRAVTEACYPGLLIVEI